MSAGLPAAEQENKVLKHRGVPAGLHLVFNASRFEIERAWREGFARALPIEARDPNADSVQAMKARFAESKAYADDRVGQKL